MKDITPMNIIDEVKIASKPPFISKITDLAENVRLKGQKETCNSLL